MADLRLITELPWGDDSNYVLELAVPSQAEDRPLLVVFSDADWRGRPARADRELLLALAEAGMPAAAATLPALETLDDGRSLLAAARRALLRAREEAAVLGAHPQRHLLLCYGSAAVTGLTLAARPEEQPAPSGVVLVDALADLRPWQGCPDDQAELLRRYAGHHRRALNPPELETAQLPPLLPLHRQQNEAGRQRLAATLEGLGGAAASRMIDDDADLIGALGAWLVGEIW